MTVLICLALVAAAAVAMVWAYVDQASDLRKAKESADHWHGRFDEKVAEYSKQTARLVTVIHERDDALSDVTRLHRNLVIVCDQHQSEHALREKAEGQVEGLKLELSAAQKQLAELTPKREKDGRFAQKAVGLREVHK